MPLEPLRETAVPGPLRLLGVLAPVALVALLEGSRLVWNGALEGWQAHVAVSVLVLGALVALYAGIFATVDAHVARQARRIDELTALRDAGLDISGELGLDAVLAKVVDHARRLIGSRYGALSVVDDAGAIEAFVTSGLDAETRRAIGPPPRGHGLLGVVLREGQRLRLDDITEDPRSEGLPAHHPPMRSLLAVPIVCHSPFRGNLYLSERRDGEAFSADDEELLARFASQAAVAIDNADLHRRARALDVAQERVRIAHELHDGQAQVLAAVNAKAQAVAEHLRQGRIEDATVQLEQLAAAARQVYADVRGDILGLRAAVDPDLGLVETLRRHVDAWAATHEIETTFLVDGEPRLAQDVELQVLRIVQEALANVRKHAAARVVQITLVQGPDDLRLTIEDDGRGFEPAGFERRRVPRFGLATMRERAEAIGGRLDVDSAPDSGTRVVLRLANRWRYGPRAVRSPVDIGTEAETVPSVRAR